MSSLIPLQTQSQQSYSIQSIKINVKSVFFQERRQNPETGEVNRQIAHSHFITGNHLP